MSSCPLLILEKFSNIFVAKTINFIIIAYEARRLFKNKEDWKISFHKIVEKDLKSPLAMILTH